MTEATAVFKIDVIHGDTNEAAHRDYHQRQHDMRGTPAEQRGEPKPVVFIVARGPGTDDRLEMSMPDRWDAVEGLAIGDEVEITIRRAAGPAKEPAPSPATETAPAPPAPRPGHPV